MVLHSIGCGRVAHRRNYSFGPEGVCPPGFFVSGLGLPVRGVGVPSTARWLAPPGMTGWDCVVILNAVKDPSPFLCQVIDRPARQPPSVRYRSRESRLRETPVSITASARAWTGGLFILNEAIHQRHPGRAERVEGSLTRLVGLPAPPNRGIRRRLPVFSCSPADPAIWVLRRGQLGEAGRNVILGTRRMLDLCAVSRILRLR